MSSYVMLFLLAPFVSGGLQARSSDPLQGLEAVKIVIEKPLPDAGPCNVQREALQLSAWRPLQDGKVRADRTVPTYVQVNVTVLESGGMCVAFIGVSVRTPAVATVSYRMSDPVAIEALLFEEGRLLTGPPSDFGQRVNASVREYVDRFVTKVKLANQR
jgi:hypothetical protein